MRPSKKLQAEWEKKLSQSGFKDYETTNRELKQFDGSRFFSRTVPLEQMEATRSYYVRAEHYLNTYDKFTTKSRLVWELHSQGMSVREIETALGISDLKKSTIHTTVVKLAKIMMETPVEVYDDNTQE